MVPTNSDSHIISKIKFRQGGNTNRLLSNYSIKVLAFSRVMSAHMNLTKSKFRCYSELIRMH
jgi:hypothetical protein